jgi:DNA replication protein DnaC
MGSGFGESVHPSLAARESQVGRLLQELSIARGDGRYLKLLARLAKTDLLVLGDWGLDSPTPEQRRVLLELLDDRYEKRSTLIASQFPTDLWYDTLADAILDHVLRNAYRVELRGESLRKTKRGLNPLKEAST